MDARKNKTLRRLILSFALFLVLRVFEELLVMPRLLQNNPYADTFGLIASFGGIIVLLVYIRYINKPLEEIGMIFSGHKVSKGILIAAICNLIPAAAAYLAEYRIYSNPGSYVKLTLFYRNANRAYSVLGTRDYIFWMFAGLAIIIITALFYEISFRGLLITLGSRSLRFPVVNLMQAGLYTVWFVLPVLRRILYQNLQIGSKAFLELLFVIIIYEMITGIKLGLLRYSTGSIWVCIFDHIAFGFIQDMVQIQYDNSSSNMLLHGSSFRVLAYQAIALVMVIVYYSYKKNKIRQIQRDHMLKQSV